MGLFSLFGGNKKAPEEYLNERDGEFLRKCVETDIFIYQAHSNAYPFENNANNYRFWGFVYPNFVWKGLNYDDSYTKIPDKVIEKLDFRKVLEIAVNKGDARAAFYYAMLHEIGIMDLYLAEVPGSLTDKDLTAEGLAAKKKKKKARFYHDEALKKECDFEKAYRFLKNQTGETYGKENAEKLHWLVDLMTVPGLSKIEKGLMELTGEDFYLFKSFGYFLTGILAGYRAPLPLATMAIHKDLYVASNITEGPDVFERRKSGVDANRKYTVRAMALGYVNQLAREGNKEAIFAKNLYGISEVAAKQEPRVNTNASFGTSGNGMKKLPTPGDLPGSIYINNVTYNLVSGCDDWATYRSFEGHEVTITYVSSLSNGEAETNVGHIRF